MNFYAPNRRWSDQFLPDIRRIVGQHLLTVAPDEMDWHQATDLVMLDATDMRIAARVRRPGFADRFPHQFTIRAQSQQGGETELSKIVNGKGDWMFYGHAGQDGSLVSWYLLDLNAFRAALIRNRQNGFQIQCGDKRNADGTAFKWFDIRSFPSEPPLVVARG